MYMHIHTVFQILLPDGFLEDTDYNSLCYTANPCCLPILYIVVSICYFQINNLPLPLTFPF